jgi:hypothetical protein
MSHVYHELVELHDLLDAVYEDTFSDSQVVQLQALLKNSCSARREYLRAINLHGTLYWDLGGEPQPGRLSSASRPTVIRETHSVASSDDTRSKIPGESPVSALPSSRFPPFLTNTFPGTAGYFSSDWPVAYLVATVILVIGLMIASLVPVSHVQQIGKQSPAPSVERQQLEPNRTTVGHVAGTVDCQWSKEDTTVIGGAPIYLGCKYVLSSGLMEIAYDTGAKVVLQGPVTYEVESPAGVFLSVGKLTARVQKSEIRNPKSETISKSPNLQISKSEIPHPSLTSDLCPLFSIRTPTATVTDLGTEFGVTVSKEGATQVQVLQGSVEFGEIGQESGTGHRSRLTVGQAAEITRHSRGIKAVVFEAGSYTRRLRQASDVPAEAAYIEDVLADRPLGYWPLNEPARVTKFLDRSGNGFHGFAEGKVVSGQPGPLGAGSRAVAFDGGRIDIGRQDRFALRNDFSVEAWVSIVEPRGVARIVSVDDGTELSRRVGWGLGYVPPFRSGAGSTRPCFFFTVYNEQEVPMPTICPPREQWVHVAAVVDRSNGVHLFFNGDRQTSGPRPNKAAQTGPAWVEIGALGNGDERWKGQLAHVAVYPRALEPQRIKSHWQRVVQGSSSTE